jgi:O-methyltransferase involved in polyketide biosynthesis
MNEVNKTLYIPLYGKAYVSRKGIILSDKTAERIWDNVNFPLKGKSKSKYLAYYMGMRAAVFDDWVKEKLALSPDCVVLHLGCGLDSRIYRVNDSTHIWYDIDFPSVISERKKFYEETNLYKMIPSDITDFNWLKQIQNAKNAVVVMEGLAMYLNLEALNALFSKLSAHFDNLSVLVDCYTNFGAKMTKLKNPINEVGVTNVYGLDEPNLLENEKLKFLAERELTPDHLIEELEGFEKKLFKKLYAGKISKKLYKLYEYKTQN